MKKCMLLLALFSLTGSLLAQTQEPRIEKKEKTIIIKKWTDENGVEQVETFENGDVSDDAPTKGSVKVFRDGNKNIIIIEGLDTMHFDLPDMDAMKDMARDLKPQFKEFFSEEQLRELEMAGQRIRSAMSEKAFLGVVTTGAPNDEGALIEEVVEDSPAAKAGLRSGDIILSIGATKVKNHEDVVAAMKTLKPEEQTVIQLMREGAQQEIPVVLGKRKMEMSFHMAPAPFGEGHQWKRHAQSRAERPQGAWLGIMMDKHEHGVEITDVIRNSPARAIGLKSGDVLYKIDRTVLSSPEEVANLIKDKKEGDQVTLYLRRDGKKVTLPVVLGDRAACCDHMPGCCEDKNAQVKREMRVFEWEEDAIAPPSSFDEKIANLEVFPNPASEELNVRFSTQDESAVVIRLVNEQGKGVLEIELSGMKAYNERMPISRLPNGVYNLIVQQGGAIVTRSVVITR